MAGTVVSDTIQDGSGNTVSTTTVIKGSAKAWVSFNGSTSTIYAGFNVSSISRSSQGQYTVNLTSALADTNYTVLVTSDVQATGLLGMFNSSGKTTSAFMVDTLNTSFVHVDSGTVMVAVFR